MVFHCFALTQDMPLKSRPGFALFILALEEHTLAPASSAALPNLCTHRHLLQPPSGFGTVTLGSWCQTHTAEQFVVLSCPVRAAVRRLPCPWLPPARRQLHSSAVCKQLCSSCSNCSLEDPSCWGVLQSCEATAASPQCARAS